MRDKDALQEVILKEIKVALMSMEDDLARSSCATLHIDMLKQIDYDEEELRLPLMGQSITGEAGFEQTIGETTERIAHHKQIRYEDDKTSICQNSAASYKNGIVLNNISEICATEIGFMQSPDIQTSKLLFVRLEEEERT